MAEFGAQATQLSAPQGAGSSPIAPVQEQVVNTSTLPMLASVGDVIGRGISAFVKSETKDVESKVISDFVQRQNAIDLDETMSPSEKAVRSRALFNQALATYPGQQQALTRTRTALASGGLLSETEEAVKSELQLRQAAKTAAQADGIEFYQGMSKAAEDSLLKAHASGVRMRKQFEELTKRNAEARAQGSYDRDVVAAQTKEQSLALITDLAGANLDSSRSVALDLKSQVATGKKSLDQARIDLASHFARINMALTAAGGTNPEMASSYARTFGDLQKLGESILDPKNDADNLQGQMDQLVRSQGLAALQRDPMAQKTIAASELFKNSPLALQTAIQGSPAATKAISDMLRADPAANEPITPTVGNKGIEKDVFKTLKESVSSINANPANTKANEETSRIINHSLKQVGDMVGRGDAKTLQESVKFFASAEYGKWVSNNTVDPQIQTNAARTFKTVYEQAVVKGIQQELDSVFITNTGLQPGRAATGAKLSSQTAPFDRSNLVINFTGSGITFDMKNVPTDPAEARAAAATLERLRTTQTAANELIRLGAHIEGNVNYAKQWEDNKHIYFPTMYSPYKNLEIGQVVDGMKYMGGDASKQSSWKQVK